ncbi:MAG TPA: hypothetical protein VF189_01760 [Patescibacteria group bacterium]
MVGEGLPSCLSDIVEQTAEDGSIPTPGAIRQCWATCPHFKEAINYQNITDEKIKDLRRRYKNGEFLNCRNR